MFVLKTTEGDTAEISYSQERAPPCLTEVITDLPVVVSELTQIPILQCPLMVTKLTDPIIKYTQPFVIKSFVFHVVII